MKKRTLSIISIVGATLGMAILANAASIKNIKSVKTTATAPTAEKTATLATAPTAEKTATLVTAPTAEKTTHTLVEENRNIHKAAMTKIASSKSVGQSSGDQVAKKTKQTTPARHSTKSARMIENMMG